MKKFISAILAATMLSSFGTAFAEDIDIAGTAGILEPEFNTPAGPTLIYNATEIGEEGAMPFIENDRTMLPFRYLLENIGASVEYDEPTRTVKAAKDEISIGFSLDDTYIDVTKNGETERIVQDTANIIRDDRVYVPIRFMSEAFELNVGWDSYTQTAIIVDIPAYIDALEESAPEFVRFMEISGTLPESYTQTLDMTVDFRSEIEAETLDFGLNLDSEFSLSNGAAAADAIFDMASSSFVEMGMDANALKDISFNFMYDDGQLYIKTNLVDKLKVLMPDSQTVNSVSAFVTEKTWFKADIYELFELLGLPAELVSIIKSSLSGNSSKATLEETMKTMYASQITSVFDAYMIDEMFAIYNTLFGKMITITEKGENNYEITYSLTEEDIAEMITSSDPEIEITADELGIIFDFTGKTVIENGLATSSDLSFEMGEAYGNVLKITANSGLTPDTNKEIVLPETALNLTDILGLIM